MMVPDAQLGAYWGSYGLGCRLPVTNPPGFQSLNIQITPESSLTGKGAYQSGLYIDMKPCSLETAS